MCEEKFAHGNALLVQRRYVAVNMFYVSPSQKVKVERISFTTFYWILTLIQLIQRFFERKLNLTQNLHIFIPPNERVLNILVE